MVVGGGFIGLEMAENLTARELEVTIIEMADQLMPPLDPEMADFVRRRLVTHAAHAHLGDGVAGFEPPAGTPGADHGRSKQVGTHTKGDFLNFGAE